MNIERYKWPVIVAASLHGALLLCTPNTPPIIRVPPVKADPGLTPPPIEQIEMRAPEETSAGEASGGGNPLPGLPDEPVLADLHDVFTVPTVDRSAPDKPVTDLKFLPTGPVGPGIGPGKIGPPGISAVTNLDRVPRAMAQPAPRYPDELRRASVEGSATVEFIVGIDGHVMSAEAVKWTHREFASAAVDAVLHWKFEPGTIDGRKVRFRMAIPIQFNATGS